MGIFGVMREFSTDGASVFNSEDTKDFLAKFGVKHRVSSPYNPHSNQRAEGAVKQAKRMIRDATGPGGSLDTDAILASLLNHRNTPDKVTGMSPSEVVFGRKVKDLLPIIPGRKLTVDPRWQERLDFRKKLLEDKHSKRGAELEEHCRTPRKLNVGEAVLLQNQTAKNNKRWDLEGKVVRLGDFDKVIIKLEDSGKITTRNRRFVRPKFSSSSKKIMERNDKTKHVENEENFKEKSFEPRRSPRNHSRNSNQNKS